jgi:hypothetical protein
MILIVYLYRKKEKDSYLKQMFDIDHQYNLMDKRKERYLHPIVDIVHHLNMGEYIQLLKKLSKINLIESKEEIHTCTN